MAQRRSCNDVESAERVEGVDIRDVARDEDDVEGEAIGESGAARFDQLCASVCKRMRSGLMVK
jgi:hypothetical protein